MSVEITLERDGVRMNIGEKIRSLRVAKLMTQSELAGNQITRNMLSSIENGVAQPSLSTILYIAKRLNVPVGFLLAEEGDEIIYQKMNSLSNIKRAYRTGDWMGCRSLCNSACSEPDDEIRLLLAECDLQIAIDAFWNGRLRYACRFFDEALLYAKETLYPTQHILAQAKLYFRYMQRISPTLDSNVLDGLEVTEFFCYTPFSLYLETIESLEKDENKAITDFNEAFPQENGFFSLHLQAKYLMLRSGYEGAKKLLLSLLQSDEVSLNEISLYAVLCDLEICCRETDDFKGAYRYSNEKVAILEQLLKD